MQLAALRTRGFRNLAGPQLEIDGRLTVVHGANGAGKTNLLEAAFFALTGRSCRTRREREMIRFGEATARAEARLLPGPGEADHEMTMIAAVSHAEGRSRRVDGRAAIPEDDLRRPAVSVFMPDRLSLVKGPPRPRRAHLDRLGAAIWPARARARAAYEQALAQRNALLVRVRRGLEAVALDAWDHELAVRALPLVAMRREAADQLREPFAASAAALGLEGTASLAYRPATGEATGETIEATLRERREGDLARGHTGWGPHRDEVELSRGGRAIRRYASQGEQRIALLALLFAEREALRRARRTLPLMLLDDVMSELDPDRRSRLVELLDAGGQALVTATELEHVPGAASARLVRIENGEVAM